MKQSCREGRHQWRGVIRLSDRTHGKQCFNCELFIEDENTGNPESRSIGKPYKKTRTKNKRNPKEWDYYEE